MPLRIVTSAPAAAAAGQFAGFVTTHWPSIALCAQKDELAFAARSELCQTYWAPVFSYLRRAGFSGHDAEDFTQGFFERILSRPWFERAERDRGRFRTFLLLSLRRFVSDELAKGAAQRRGGVAVHLPLDRLEPADEPAASELAFDADWAVAVVDASLRRLESEWVDAGKTLEFTRLKRFLTALGDGEAYDQEAAAVGSTPGAIKTAVSRLRRRYGAILREEVARTVSTPAEVAEELRHIRQALAAA